MWGLLAAGAVSGVVLGYVFQRSDLCFHSAWRGLTEGRYHLAKIWILGVAIAAVGLGVIFAADVWALSEGLAFRPRGNIAGGLIIGVGMVIARSCVSGLFYKLGSGMLGAAVGLGAWFVGDVAGARWLVGGDGVDLRGSTLDVGGATVPEVLGVDRLVVAVVFLVVVVGLLARSQRGTATGNRWAWPLGGIALGLGTIVAWILAGVSDAGFGPSTVGGAATLVNAGPVNTWLVAFLVALIFGALIAARQSRTLWVRGEGRLREGGVRYAQLAAGGLLLGIGGQVGGGCNLGHGLSGVAQLNVSSWVVVVSIVAGIAAAGAVQRSLTPAAAAEADWRVQPATA